jgi:hypothetical protein
MNEIILRSIARFGFNLMLSTLFEVEHDDSPDLDVDVSSDDFDPTVQIGQDDSIEDNYWDDPLDDESIDGEIYHSSRPDDRIRFGNSSEINKYESELQHKKGQVDFDRHLVNKEETECGSLQGRINEVPSQQPIPDLELELKSHQRKLSQAQADFATHQKEEFQLVDRLNELRSSSSKN